jgi:hypothetical protein
LLYYTDNNKARGDGGMEQTTTKTKFLITLSKTRMHWKNGKQFKKIMQKNGTRKKLQEKRI